MQSLCDLEPGALLGAGRSRRVYEYGPSNVIKIEKRSRMLQQNAIEWQTWQWARGGPYEILFAPCGEIRDRGLVLIHRRVEPLSGSAPLPDLPDWLWERTPENFGYLDGRIVCCDYGTVPHHVFM